VPLTSSSPTADAIAECVSLAVTAPDAMSRARCRIAGQLSLARLTAPVCIMFSAVSRYVRAATDIVDDVVGDTAGVAVEGGVDVGVAEEDCAADEGIVDVADDVTVEGTGGG